MHQRRNPQKHQAGLDGIPEIGSETKKDCACKRECIRYGVDQCAALRFSAQYECRIGGGQLKHESRRHRNRLTVGSQEKRAGKHGEPDAGRNIVARRFADPHRHAGRNLHIAYGNTPGQLDVLQ